MSVRRRVPGWLAVLFLVLFWPVGIVLTWRTIWTERAKATVTISIVCLVALLLLPFNVAVWLGLAASLKNPTSASPTPQARQPAIATATTISSAATATTVQTPTSSPSGPTHRSSD